MRLCRLLSQPYRKPECASVTGYTLDADLPPHLFHKLLANGEAQTGTAELPCGRGIHLGKRPEQKSLCFGGNADARVDHGKFDPGALGSFFPSSHMNHHLALVGELDRIANEIDENLPEAAR